MKKLILSAAIVAVLAFPAAAQFMPCFAPAPMPAKQVRATQTIRNNRTGEYGVRYIYVDGTVWDDFLSTRVPVVVEAFSQVYKINPMAWFNITFYMPVAGRCVGSFESYDDRSDAYKVVQDAAGRYIRVPIQTRGDVEIIIISDAEWARINGAISLSSYAAVYTTGRSYGGTFGVDLQPGWYHLAVYNGFSAAAKSVNLKFGGKLPEKRP